MYYRPTLMVYLIVCLFFCRILRDVLLFFIFTFVYYNMSDSNLKNVADLKIDQLTINVHFM